MAVRYEWQERRGGRRYVRVVEPDVPVKVAKADVAKAEVVPEIVIEAESEPEAVAAPKRGRPKKVADDE